MTQPLSVLELSKNFGSIKAVDTLTFEVPDKSVFGILGPNGSGKTTTLGMILGVSNPSKGSFKWFGQSPSAASRRKIGAILETPTFYPYLSAYENLKIVACIKDVSFFRVDKVLEIVQLYDRRNSAFNTYSLGMKQRLAIASALLADPEVLILDEPTNGLDPQGIADIRLLIKDIASQGKTIILASHLLDEVEKVCDELAVLKNGRLIYRGRAKSLIGDTQILSLKSDNLDELEQKIRLWSICEKTERSEEAVLLYTKEKLSGAEVNKYLFQQGVVLSELSIQHHTLEQQFLALLKND